MVVVFSSMAAPLEGAVVAGSETRPSDGQYEMPGGSRHDRLA